jgi:hypothetical protein
VVIRPNYGTTLIVPFMPRLPWNLQWYLNVPTAVKRRVKDCPGFRVPEFQPFDVEVCCVPGELTFFHLMRSPLWIVIVMGMYLRLFVIFTRCVVDAAELADTTLAPVSPNASVVETIRNAILRMAPSLDSPLPLMDYTNEVPSGMPVLRAFPFDREDGRP